MGDKIEEVGRLWCCIVMEKPRLHVLVEKLLFVFTDLACACRSGGSVRGFFLWCIADTLTGKSCTSPLCAKSPWGTLHTGVVGAGVAAVPWGRRRRAAAAAQRRRAGDSNVTVYLKYSSWPRQAPLGLFSCCRLTYARMLPCRPPGTPSRAGWGGGKGGQNDDRSVGGSRGPPPGGRWDP